MFTQKKIGKMCSLNLANKRIIVLAHVLTSVPADDLKEYLLKERTKELLFIGHPLYYKLGRPGSYYEVFKNGEQTKKEQLKNRNINQFVRFFVDFTLSLFWILKTPGKWDLIVALDNLNTLAGLLLRTIGKVDKIIYYTIDFTPQRFDNKLLNNFYHYLDKLCVQHTNLTWNVSPRISEGRYKIRGIDPTVYNRQVVVPIGVWLDRIPVKSFEEINRHTIAYAGGLSAHQGIQLILDALPQVVEKINVLKFLIIGMGNYETELKAQVEKLGIGRFVEFTGYLENMRDVESRLSSCGLGLAMYNEELARWSYYADPSKIKSYLASALPVITTPLTYMAKDIEQKECGIVCNYDKAEVTRAILTIMENPDLHKRYRENARGYIKNYDWNVVFYNGLYPIIQG